MKRQTKGNAVDIRIQGDELEFNRIQLEHNLQNTELSFHLSSTSDEENDGGYKGRRRRTQHHLNSSLEYPRHISEPINELPSFTRRSARERFADEDQNPHAWSYCTDDDEDRISPYGGETISTVAHHASALTITAGLGGGRTARRDPSISGAEYDPERPLDRIIAGVNGKLSMFDDPSKHQGITYDPLVFDNTAELDRILDTGHIPSLPTNNSRSVHPTPPTSSGSASDSDGSPPQHSPSRPRLTDHLRHVSFSPKRPRNSPIAQSHQGSPLARANRTLGEHDASQNIPTPRPIRRTNPASNNSVKYAQPEFKSKGTALSNEGSRFTRMARGINKEIEETREQLNAVKHHPRMRPASPVEKNPFHDSVNQSVTRGTGMRDTSRRSARDATNGRIHLPDVTGLTNAVASPAKPGTDYHPYKGDGKPRDSEARLLQTMNAVQSQLRDLEEENGISRRRVRELEMELDECKREVARERTRLFEREELETHNYAYNRSKGKAKAKDGPPDIDDERLHARYKEAVDEKKALEALINSLRSHLTRLTTELASHQSLLAELRNLRESDSQALKEKSADILQIREEVQRLAGEVEVLRGVVEEGLKERRASREVQVENSVADVGMSQDLQEEDEEADEQHSEQESESEQEEEEEEEDDDEIESFDSRSLQNESSPAHRVADRTMRTDFATIGGSTNLGESTNGGPQFVGDAELEEIAAEVEERRSNNSIELDNNPLRPSSPIRRNRLGAENVEDNGEAHRSTYSSPPQPPVQSNSRPAAPTPSHATRQYQRGQDMDADPETPFPQIRGEHLERLFFSAPEHNPKTCTVCYRRRDRRSSGPTSWSRPQGAHEYGEEDEGYEGSEGAEAERVTGVNKGKEHEYVTSKNSAHWRKVGRANGLPPQTVVARVIRELEDDFTHYKSIYVELADQYKDMDAASDVPRRNLLARHLREVVDVLEQKGDQIASLYDLLEFKDKPISETTIPERRNVRPRT